MTDFSEFLHPVVLGYLPYAVGLVLALAGLFVVRILMRSAVNKKVRSIKDDAAMSMMDIDRMRKKGLISEQEFRAIRHSLAESEVDKDRRRRQAEREKVLLAQVERDPEAARLLLDLPPGENGECGMRNAQIPGARASLGPRTVPSAPASTAQARPASKPNIASGGVELQTKTPAPAPKKTPQPAGRPSDLDVLLEKGAITPEEYERLKSFFQ